MYKKIFQIISTIAVIAAVECPLAAFGVSELEGRARTVGAQLAMQMELNQLTGQNHTTFYNAIKAATDAQCDLVAHSTGSGREGLLEFNQHANQAKHNFTNNDFEDYRDDDRKSYDDYIDEDNDWNPCNQNPY